MLRYIELVGLVLTLVGGAAAAEAGAPETPAADHRKVEPFDLGQVRLWDGPFREAMERDRQYLRSLDNDRQLHTFRLTAGLPTHAKPLGGWESPDDRARGEFFGHSLSACAMMYAATGDKELKAKVDTLVVELAKCQAALGPRGYLDALPEADFDRLETGDLIWGNYYTVHKILAGLLDAYTYCGNRQALEIATKLADWVDLRTRGQSVAHFAKTWHRDLHVEYGGLNEALLNLYAITGNRCCLETARRFDDEALYGPLAQGRDALKGLHVNTQIPKIIGAARAYEVTGETRYRQIAEYFWHEVTAKRCYCTGGTSNYELWQSPPGKLAVELGPHTQECCCTYNLLKLTRHIFMWQPEAAVGDFYERALYNGILGTQNPDNGMTMYYVPLASGYWKTFASPLDSFWCCTGTGVESFAKLADSIYFHGDDELWINLFLPSVLSWPAKGLSLRQETRFPDSDRTTLRFVAARPVDIALRIRIPYWAKQGVTMRLNGDPLALSASAAGYATVRRTWQDGDRLEIEMPMSLHLHRMPDEPQMAAVMYGPLVLAGRLGTKGVKQEQLHAATMGPEGKPVVVPWFAVDSDDLSAWIRPVEGKSLEFRTFGQRTDVTLVPLCRLFGECYGVYWHIYRKGSPEHRQRLAGERR
jgi:hypothetical protein